MPKATSAVEICNLALSQLKVSPISSIQPPDEGSEAASQCAQWYDQARLETLRGHTWNFARKRLEITADSAAPSFGFAAAYTLPVDFVRPVWVGFDGVEITDEEYDIEDGKLLTGSNGTLQLVYIYDHENPASWTPDFVTSFATNLAKWVGPALSASEGNTRLAENRSMTSMRNAKSVNGQENKPRRVERSRLLGRRLRGTTSVRVR